MYAFRFAPATHKSRYRVRFAPLRSTCESAGEGSTRFLAADACELVSRWIGSAKLTEGALFRAIERGYTVGDRLSDRGVARSFKRPACKTGVDAEISGHSCRRCGPKGSPFAPSDPRR